MKHKYQYLKSAEQEDDNCVIVSYNANAYLRSTNYIPHLLSVVRSIEMPRRYVGVWKIKQK